MDANPVDMQYIIQLKDGYTVRIVRFEVRKEFYDHHYTNGRDGALAAAMAFRDEQYAKHGIKPRNASKPTLKVVSRTDNGVLSGVSLNIDKGSPYFIGRMHDGTAWQKKRFNIKKLGYENAFWSAVDYRLQNSDLPIEVARDQITLHRPTMDEYVFLVTVCKDVPLPRV